MSFLQLKCGIPGGIDLGLIGLLVDDVRGPRGLSDPPAQRDDLVTGLELSELFRRLESDDLQIAVVSLESVFDHVSANPHSSVRVLGHLLGGDCRAFVTLCGPHQQASCRTLGAADPDAAFARWEEISQALNFACTENRAEKIVHQNLPRALSRGQYSVLELNLFWEGLLGCRRGLIRSTSRAGEFGIPCGASHLLVTNRETLGKRREILKELRQKLICIYSGFLDDTEIFIERCVGSARFSGTPECSFLQASARVLAPHCEEFLRTGGWPSQKLIQSFVRWYETRVHFSKFPHKTNAKVFASQFEQFFCDLWA
jgi:hypothetical protein